MVFRSHNPGPVRGMIVDLVEYESGVYAIRMYNKNFYGYPEAERDKIIAWASDLISHMNMYAPTTFEAV